MHQLTEFNSRENLDSEFANKIANILASAIVLNGKASIAVSGGSTPKGLFSILSKSDLDWSKVTVTLADERWVNIDSEASNTRLVHDNLLQNNAAQATFFHLKQGDELTADTLEELNLVAKNRFVAS